MNKFLLVVITAVLLLTGCKTSQVEVPVVLPQTHIEQESTNKLDSIFIRDSIYIKDSVYIKEKGDTVFYYKTSTKYIDKYKDRLVYKTDTITKIDSISVPVTVTKIKEVHKLNWFQQTFLYLGIVAMIILAVKVIKHRIL